MRCAERPETAAAAARGVACWTWSLHPCPSHQRLPPPPAGSGYQPGGGGGCVTAAKVVPRTPGNPGDACQTPHMADLSAAEAAVLSAVDEEWMVDRLCRLIAVPSIGGTAAESEVQHLLADWLEELDCAVDRWPIDLDAAATAADAPGQEVVRTEAWGVVGTAARRRGRRPGAGPLRAHRRRPGR